MTQTYLLQPGPINAKYRLTKPLEVLQRQNGTETVMQWEGIEAAGNSAEEAEQNLRLALANEYEITTLLRKIKNSSLTREEQAHEEKLAEIVVKN